LLRQGAGRLSGALPISFEDLVPDMIRLRGTGIQMTGRGDAVI